MENQGIRDPFPKGCMGSDRCRIPAILTTPAGTLVAACDARWSHGQDSAGNLETVVSRSQDNGITWERQFVNYFDDVVDGSDRCIFSAGFIDPVLGCDREGVLYLLTDLAPAFVGGYPVNGIVCGAEDGRHKDGEACGRLALKALEDFTHAETQVLNEETYPYYVGEAGEDGYAPVLDLQNHKSYQGYLVDEEMYLYQRDESGIHKVMIHQLDGACRPTEHMIHANIFFAASPLKAYPTYHIICRISRDDGRTWSKARIISEKFSRGGFTVVCPGRGLSYVPKETVGSLPGGKERMLFPIYDNHQGMEFTSVIYTDDQGQTWGHSGYADRSGIRENGERVKTSESQIVELPGGILRMFSRNQIDKIGYTDSTDGGETWGEYHMEEQLSYCGNCMVSAIRYSREIDGKVVLLVSYPGGDGTLYHRVNGVIAIGLYDPESGSTDWKYHYQVNQAPYYYSCLTETADGRIALWYEYEEYAIRLQLFTLEELMKD